MGPPKKYTDEAVQFLRENINNFSNQELCEELESKFNIKTKPKTLGLTLSHKGIRRDIKNFVPDVDQEIVDYIKKSKKDILILRDEIIEKFEVDIPIEKLRSLMNEEKKLPGETMNDEVKRIKQKREEFEPDEDIDGLELD